MTTRKHIHKEDFDASAERVFALLITPSSIRRWWTASSAIVQPEKGGTWAATWGADEDVPDYITVATMSDFEPPKRIVFADYRYYAKAGPLPFDADFSTEFLVTSNSNGATLQVTQDGFPSGAEADDFLAACEKGWQDTFAGIRAFLDQSEK